MSEFNWTPEEIAGIVNENRLVLFMKGTPEMPQCGFSNNVVQILNSLGMTFETFDVLSDMEIREGIKDYSNWPTIPQVYVKGEFMGGSDILIEMYNSGELREKLEIALAKGKKNYDKKQTKKAADIQRDQERALKKYK